MRRNTCTGGSRSWKIGEGYGDCKPIIGAGGIAPLSRGRAFGHVGKAPLIPKLEWFWQSCRIAAKIFHIFECLSMFTCCIWFVTYMLWKGMWPHWALHMTGRYISIAHTMDAPVICASDSATVPYTYHVINQYHLTANFYDIQTLCTHERWKNSTVLGICPGLNFHKHNQMGFMFKQKFFKKKG